MTFAERSRQRNNGINHGGSVLEDIVEDYIKHEDELTLRDKNLIIK